MESRYSILCIYVKMILGVLCVSCALCSCSDNEERRLEKALEMAGTNRAELEKVMEYYRGDSLKLRAARFLIENMQYHFSVNEKFVSKKGEPYYPDITRFGKAASVKRHCDSLMTAGWHIDRRTEYDIRCVDAEFIIRNIELAFRAWEKPWASEVSFGDFCRYILPYRSQNEPLSYARERLMERYTALLDSAGARNAMEACRIINARLKEEMRYCETGNPLRPTVEETEVSGRGTCDALCNYTTMVMRAVGVPVAVQQTVWTRMDRGHVWCAVLHEGTFHDFSPGDVQPGEYKHVLATVKYLMPAKVYRRHFEPDMSVLPEKDDGFVTYLKNPLLEDVTDEQEMQVYDLAVPDRGDASGGIVYLCNYNAGKWVPVAMGRRSEGKSIFRKVAGRNLLAVAEADGKGGLEFISDPFLTGQDGSVRFLIPDMERRVSVRFVRNEGVNSCSLYYWDNGGEYFRSIPCTAENDSIFIFDNVPDNALLLNVTDGRKYDSSVGIEEDGVFRRKSWL